MNANTNHWLRYLDEDVSQLNELYQTEQQNNEPIDIWSDFIG
ncbi:11138_t:CDS:1, partial [Ambispora leptoticha]